MWHKEGASYPLGDNFNRVILINKLYYNKPLEMNLIWIPESSLGSCLECRKSNLEIILILGSRMFYDKHPLC